MIFFFEKKEENSGDLFVEMRSKHNLGLNFQNWVLDDPFNQIIIFPTNIL